MLLKRNRFTYVLLFILMFNLAFGLISFATTTSNTDDVEVTSGGTTTGTSSTVNIPMPDADSFIKSGKTQGGVEAIKGSADAVAIQFIPILQTVANIMVIITIVLMGIKWLYAGPKERATLKEKMWAYVVGIAVVFCGVNITALVTNYLEKL